jgi:DNA-directed RNA polymerase beta subunit
MIKFNNFRLYTQVTNSIGFPLTPNNPYLLTYFSENSTLVDDYPKLGLRSVDFRMVVVPVTKIPRTIMTSELMKDYKQLGLIPYSQKQQIPQNKNFIFDLSYYLGKIDLLFRPTNYRQRSGTLIKNSFNLLLSYPQNYQKVLVYSIDLTKDTNTFVNRKFFPILQMLKDEEMEFPFDYVIFALVGEASTTYRLIVKNKDYQLTKIITLLRKITPIDINEETENEIDDISRRITNKVIDKKLVKPENKEVVKNSLVSYFKTDPKKLDHFLAKEVPYEDIVKVAASSILHKTSGNIIRATKIVDAIPKNKAETALKVIDKNFSDEIIPQEKTVTTSDHIVVQAMNVPKMVDDKSPAHLFKKRQIDFEINLKKDMWNSFKILETKEVPLKIESLNIVDKPVKYGEIEKSDEVILVVKLKDQSGNIQDIKIELPKIDPVSGTFRINGQKKCLINQIILNPITFPKPYDSKFESSYSSFHIWSKKTKKINYLEIYIASYKLPFLVLMAYSFGFDKVLKDFGIKYTISKSKPRKSDWAVKVNSDTTIIFDNVDTELKEEIINSFIRAKIGEYKIDKPFGTNEYFNDLIIKITGKINSTYKVRTNLDNIVDPVVKQVLMNQNLPISLDEIMKYMAQKVITGFVQARNDLSNQRIRNSEILVHLAQKQILAAYTNYKEQVLAGNKNAKFQIVPTKVISDFINSEIVVNMEYGNPLEEMATLSKVSPVGKSIGGIPGKDAVQMESRNVHSTYFGNIDPLDTPEGPNIGIIQQLTIDAHLTSARGLIKVKEQDNKEKSGILSTSTCMIPFIENNEGARVIMAAAQSRQILPLKNPEPPIVQTGYESILPNVLSDSFIKKSPCDGRISEITKEKITVVCKDGKKTNVDINPIPLKSGSGKNTLSMFSVVVKKGQQVKKDSIIAEGSSISNGMISLGRTLAVSIFPYKGYNFDDGVVINERLVKEDKLTSLHLVEVDITLSEKDRLLYINDMDKMTLRGEPLLRKTIGEIEELIGFEEDETTDITAGQYIKKSPGGLIAEIEVFSNIENPSKFIQLSGLIERTNKKYNKPPREKYTNRGKTIEGILIRFKIRQELIINLGDKLCNRYGNKGIISLIESEELMPRTPWGEKLDFIINPLGILSRMNMGQVYEMYCGLISRKLAELFLKTKNKRDFLDIARKVLPMLDTSKNQTISTGFLNNVAKLSDSQMAIMWEQIKNNYAFPIIVPPFKGPNFKMIRDVLKILGLKSKYKIYLPEYKTYTSYEVPFGYMYIYKLEHMGDMKIHSRSTGPVIGKVLQPTAGKGSEGGQRLGEQESLSFISYGCLMALAEFFGPMSDDHITKNEIISDIIQTGHAEYRIPKANPARDLLNAYFTSLMLESD